MKHLLILAMVSLCVGCSALDSASSVASLAGGGNKPGIGVDTEVTAGDKQQIVDVGSTTRSETKLDDVQVKDGGNINANTNHTTKRHEQNIESNGPSSIVTTNNDGVSFVVAGIFGIVLLLIGWALPQLKMYLKK